MPTSLRPLVCLLLLAFAAIPSAWGQSDMFLRLDSVKGSATDPAFKDQIVVLSFGYAITTTGSSSTVGGKSIAGDLIMTKPIDIATPVLAQAAASSQPYQQATLSITQQVKGEKTVVYTITLSNVRVDSVSQSGPNTAYPAFPLTEKIELSYASINWQYGTTKAGYNFAQNKTADEFPDAGSDNSASPSSMGADSFAPAK